jgi:hypothetical protein
MSQLLQFVGAILVLAPFALAQFRLLGQQSAPYLVLNLLGSGLLAILAYAGAQWGFVLLEGVWALVSLWSLATYLASTRGSTT